MKHAGQAHHPLPLLKPWRTPVSACACNQSHAAPHLQRDPHAAPRRARHAAGVHAAVPRRAAAHQPLVPRALQEAGRQAAVLPVLPARKHLRARRGGMTAGRSARVASQPLGLCSAWAAALRHCC